MVFACQSCSRLLWGFFLRILVADPWAPAVPCQDTSRKNTLDDSSKMAGQRHEHNMVSLFSVRMCPQQCPLVLLLVCVLIQSHDEISGVCEVSTLSLSLFMPCLPHLSCVCLLTFFPLCCPFTTEQILFHFVCDAMT